jgi:hypothetical protein
MPDILPRPLSEMPSSNPSIDSPQTQVSQFATVSPLHPVILLALARCSTPLVPDERLEPLTLLDPSLQHYHERRGRTGARLGPCRVGKRAACWSSSVRRAEP